MTYKITQTTWLERETQRLKGVLTQFMQHNIEYEGAQLKDRARRLGLNYTTQEFAQLRDALIADGTIEEV